MSDVVDDTIEIGEATLAVVGLSNVLKGDMPRIGVEKQREIIGLDKTIDKMARAFVYDELPRTLKMPRPWTYRQILDKFSKPIPEETMRQVTAAFPEDAIDTALSFKSTLVQAHKHASDLMPSAQIDTYLGPKNIMPTSDLMFDFFNQLWVIDDPLILFQLMQCGGLNPEQTNAVKEFFPSIYNYMTKAILDAIIARNHREASFMFLPPRADRGLATFKQQRIVPYGVNIHDVPPPQPKAEPAAPKLRTTLQTSGQKAAEVSG